MGSVHPKKVAAAIAAVLQCAAEAVADADALCPVSPPAPRVLAAAPFTPPALWGWAGRQDAMHDRVVWQRRLSRSW